MVEQTHIKPSKQSLRAIDCLSMFIGDVIGGIGPYLAIYLKTSRNWDQGAIGTVLSAAGIATIIAQTPAGALIDRFTQKRFILCASAVLMALSAFAVTAFSGFNAVMAAQILYGGAAAVAGPCIVAITLGVVGPKLFAKRIARNEAFNHVGNVIAAVLAGMAGYLISPNWIFYFIGFFALASVVATLFIRKDEIDHDVARGAVDDEQDSGHNIARKPIEVAADDEQTSSQYVTTEQSEVAANSKTEASDLKRQNFASENKSGGASILAVLADKHIVAFAIAVALFHLANAAMLPLAGQYLSEGHAKTAPVWISACIIAAQVIMIPTSLLAGKFADSWGRKPVFLIAMAALPIRGVLYTFSNSPALVVPIQMLDGIGAGIFGVLVSVIVSDLTEGTGRYNITRGMVITAQGIGAALSNALAGYIVQKAGYSAGFLSLAGIGLVGLIICIIGLPETRDRARAGS